MVEQMFIEGEEPFIYRPPNIFEEHSLITIRTTSERFRIERLEAAGHDLYDKLWNVFLGLLLAFFWRGKMPNDEAIDTLVKKCFDQMQDDEAFLADFTTAAHNWSSKGPLPDDDRLLRPFGPGHNKIVLHFLNLIKTEVSNLSLWYLQH